MVHRLHAGDTRTWQLCAAQYSVIRSAVAAWLTELRHLA
jgi:hypothetical protein